MAKPELTEEQKGRFRIEFNQLMLKAPQRLQKIWHGNIEWLGDEPHADNEVQFRLKGKLKDDFNKLLIRISQRKI
jgi:hypothetical protein